MSRPTGPRPGIEPRGTRDAQALAVLLLAAVLGVGTALSLLGPGSSEFPRPPAPGRAAPAGEQAMPRSETATPTRPRASRVETLNLNTADAEALETVAGIGPTLAARIVAYRLAHGRFRSVEDLARVPGVGPKRWEQMRRAIHVAPEEP
jgi:competence protein ComEA